MYINRKIYRNLKKHMANKQVTVLTGMRRTGKTTLVHNLLNDISSTNKIYLDLERLDNREILQVKNYDVVIESLKQRKLDVKKKMYVAFDELQLVPEAPSVLKYLYDNYDIKFIVTGSSSYYLKNLFSESMAGRKKIFELFPLDFGEYLEFKGVKYISKPLNNLSFSSQEYERVRKHYEDFILYGGFPEVVLADSKSDKQDLLRDIVSSYVNIDIKLLSDLRNHDTVYALMKILASRIGTKLDYAKISRLLGVSRNTVVSYVTFLEKAYLISRLPVVSKNRDREIVKAKKIYFCDNGIVSVLAGVADGSMFENALYNQLRRFGELAYYALKGGQEIDFILDNERAFEVKESPTYSDLQKLDKLSRILGTKERSLIGRYEVPKFKDYIWGGEIR